MARKSRKKFNQTENETTIHSAPNLAAIYGRLSVEDNHYSEGESLQNQITYLREFVDRNEEEFQLVEVYVDNGATGTDFNREGWQSMIADVKTGKINCIIVKDLSRIGRNYIDVGNYLEKIFPFLHVRVISVNDNFDSEKQPFENNLLIHSLTNIVNEYYARDISKKVLQTKKVMQSNGEYTSGVYPYGYKKSDENKRKIAVDMETAVVVKKIFEWRISGKSCPWIANYLNDLAIPSPGLYRFMNGEKSFEKCRNSKWKVEHISDILNNQAYLGHMVQGKTKHSHFQNNGKSQRIPRENWIVVQNTHEPIITQEQFDIAAKMAAESRKEYEARMNAHADIPHTENPLRKKIFCGNCGTRMFRRSKVTGNMRNYHYYCDARRRKLDSKCNQPYIKEEMLMKSIKFVTQKQLQLLGRQQAWQKENRTTKENKKSYSHKQRRQKDLEQEMLHIKNQKKELYEDMKKGMLQQADFKAMCKSLSKQQTLCEQEIQRLINYENPEAETINTLKNYSENIFELEAEEIPIDLLDILIEKVTVFSSDHIEVTYTYSDMAKECRKEMRS